jgi:hypothetical protein
MSSDRYRSSRFANAPTTRPPFPRCPPNSLMGCAHGLKDRVAFRQLPPGLADGQLQDLAAGRPCRACSDSAETRREIVPSASGPTNCLLAQSGGLAGTHQEVVHRRARRMASPRRARHCLGQGELHDRGDQTEVIVVHCAFQDGSPQDPTGAGGRAAWTRLPRCWTLACAPRNDWRAPVSSNHADMEGRPCRPPVIAS